MRRLSLLLLGFALCFVSLGVSADAADTEPQAQILDAQAHIDSERVWLDARVSLTLNSAARRALGKGLPLKLTAYTKIFRAQTLWWDELVLNRKHSFRLEYHELSQQYIIEDLSSGVQRISASQQAALRELGMLYRLRLFHTRHLIPGDTYYGELRTELAIEEIPLALKASAIMSDDWIMRSNTFTWPLQ